MPKFIAQQDQMDCGPACLAMVAAAHGKSYDLQYLRNHSFISREGVSLLGITEAAQKIGLQTACVKLDIQSLVDIPLPCILHWNQNHFVVLEKAQKPTALFRQKLCSYKIADPAQGVLSIQEETLNKSWLNEDGMGIALMLNPTSDFYKAKPDKVNESGIGYLYKIIQPYKADLVKLLACLLIGNLFTLVFPFLTQALVDHGISPKHVNNVVTILLAQCFVFFGSIVVEIIRNMMTLFIGTRINIAIISDFLRKLLKLPVKFFDTKMMGDFNQRIMDHDRIENFLTSQSLITIFSIINFLVFFFVLAYYDIRIVLIYTILTGMAIGWTLIFMNRRKALDYSKFQNKSENQEAIFELISGMQEIKMNSFENYKRNEWEKIQTRLLDINYKGLKINQLQITGFDFLNQIKNILVTYIAAREAITGHVTLGAVLAISYIIGQMNGPINQLLGFFRSLQDAKLSLARLSEIQEQTEEEKTGQVDFNSIGPGVNNGIMVRNLNFQYEGPKSPFVLEDMSLLIPEGKTTAIVGTSGSGKTTFMKLLLKFYDTTSGDILINDHNLQDISANSWRKNCGIVLQDGFIFSDTIERNIATGDEHIDERRLEQAIGMANIKDFITSLPIGLKTKLGAAGSGISGGQRQRILIARAIYKNPQYIFFDEATSALDAENEKIIHNNLKDFFKMKTVVIIAHRLSTVKNADQIIVLNNGRIVEVGRHTGLVENKSFYYNLVKNQLELGN
ncbi:MAG: peptidase domain-containing ABC transporter [Mucilaginibacter sp.]